MAHTPGPWKVIRWNQEGATYGEPIKRVKVVAPDGTVICDNEPYYPMELLEENAGIVGAAPELVMVLEGLLEISHRLNGCNVAECLVCQDTNSKLEAARSVIAKVKGE